MPGQTAPRLATADMIAAMRPGSVVVDMLAAFGGNVEGSVPGQDVTIASSRGDGEITIVGLTTPAADLPADASRLYAKNVLNVVNLLVTEDGCAVDFTDDILDGATITHDGVNRLAAPSEPTTEPGQGAQP